jgi:hypothetical protein
MSGLDGNSGKKDRFRIAYPAIPGPLNELEYFPAP